PKVTWLGGDAGHHGERVRKTIGGWRNTDINGLPLRIDTLSTRLTQVANYRRTICGVGPKDYLLRRINGTVEPLIQKGSKARRALTPPGGRDDIHIWSGQRLAETALRTGLADWVMEKVA